MNLEEILDPFTFADLVNYINNGADYNDYPHCYDDIYDEEIED